MEATVQERPHPQTPDTYLYRVRHMFREDVSRRFGAVYSMCALARRSHDERARLFSPVVIGPGNIPVFAWPPAEIDECFLERA